MNRTLMLALLTLCCACGDTAEDAASAVNVTVSSFEAVEDGGLPELSFTFKNSGEVKIDSVSINVNLLRDQVIIGSGLGAHATGLMPAQAAITRVLLHSIDSHTDYDCFESTLRLVSQQTSPATLKTIPGPTNCD